MKSYAIWFEGTWFISVQNYEPIFHKRGGYFFTERNVVEKFLEYIRSRIKEKGGNPDHCVIVEFDIVVPEHMLCN